MRPHTASAILCLDIGGSFIKAGRFAGAGDITLIGRHPTPLDDFDAFAGVIADLLAGRDKAEAVAISIAGIVDPDGGRLKCANIPCIDGRSLADELSARLERRVFVANDADCFTLAEATVGAGAGHRIVFGAILGTGVGGGLVIDGKLLVGAGGLTGEWGHSPVLHRQAGTPLVDIPHFPCGCGQRGCVDTVGGARGLERLHQTLHGAVLSSQTLLAAWRDGDAAAARTVDCYIDLLAPPLALVINVIGATVVPVGGGLSSVAPLIARLDIAVRDRILRRLPGPLLVQARCKVEPGLIGAGILGLKQAEA